MHAAAGHQLFSVHDRMIVKKRHRPDGKVLSLAFGLTNALTFSTLMPMTFFIEVRPFHLRVFSSLFVNIAAGFILLLLTSTTTLALTLDILGATITLLFALKAEKLLEEL